MNDYSSLQRSLRDIKYTCLPQHDEPCDAPALKNRIQGRLGEIRELIDRRNALDPKSEKAVKLSAQVRSELVRATGLIDQLDDGQGDVVKAAYMHVQQLEMLAANREEPTATPALNAFLTAKLPDLDTVPTPAPTIDAVEGFQKQVDNETQIESMLDKVHDGVVDLRQQAHVISDAVDSQDIVMSELAGGVETANDQLDTLNRSLVDTLNRVRRPCQLMCDVVLCLVFLAVIGLTVKIVADRARNH